MSIKDHIKFYRQEVEPFGARLIAVSKTHPAPAILEAYEAGQRLFGENKVQELMDKQPTLPADIGWHLIGHLQTNKVKYVAPVVSLIHAVDSEKVLLEIEKQGARAGRVIPCLLQIFIAQEETKFGLHESEALSLITNPVMQSLQFVRIEGLMGMASLTENQTQIRQEFRSLRRLFDDVAKLPLPGHIRMKELSMGMTSDYRVALEEGSTLIRVGTAIFGQRR
ncbi:MAG: YggS family pyridoxal phosphate-dependent enzyme [Cyclobacteriaceae bacterium]|jgi:pyridoxal phosphate enzyme (YggS family)